MSAYRYWNKEETEINWNYNNVMIQVQLKCVKEMQGGTLVEMSHLLQTH